ncbi:dimethylargininase [Salsipaludibacter albus]|uniref:dimethylargininase n=1 Tax=Salsipaludibacter albus TaxID=2849650 RepID=UPI001EE3BAD5|nr:dimethylargininase [Salsipaludibacter albus]MBY5162765.1 N(G),N(G)-dimethylarginine dimethylaminohydrolase [Salsipaludibacter albus]
MPTALVRRPGPRLAEGLVTHVDRVPVDLDLARRQWEGYVAALDASGWTTVEVEPADDCPDAVFVEDSAIVHGDLAVVTRPGAPQRRPETAGTAAALEAAGLRTVRLAAPATLDGGDVMQVGRTVYVGEGGRTNAAGITQLAGHLEPLGASVVAVPVTRVLHLKSAVTALPDGTVIGHAPLVDTPELFPSFLPVPEEPGAHVVVLDPGTVLMATGAPRTMALLADRGLDVVTVDVGEFTKLEGCVTCLSIRLRD